MSTKIFEYFISYLTDIKYLSFKKSPLQLPYKSLTGPRVSKAGRPYLYGSRTYRQVFKHVFRRLDAPHPYNWCFHGLPRLPDQPQGHRFDRRSRQPTSLVAQTRLPAPQVNRHGRIGVRNSERGCPGIHRRPGNKSNICNHWREFNPERPLPSRAPGRPNHLSHEHGVVPELHPPPFDVRAGYVQLIGCQPLGILQNPYHLDVILNRIAKNVRDDRCIVISQYREFFGHKRPDPYVLESHGIQHSGRSLAESGRGGALHRFPG